MCGGIYALVLRVWANNFNMGMKHKEEYAIYKTCQAWTEKEAMKEASWSVKLMFKDCHGKASLVEQVAIEIDYLLGYHNVDFIPEKEVLEKAQEIIDMVRGVKQSGA